MKDFKCKKYWIINFLSHTDHVMQRIVLNVKRFEGPGRFQIKVQLRKTFVHRVLIHMTLVYKCLYPTLMDSNIQNAPLLCLELYEKVLPAQALSLTKYDNSSKPHGSTDKNLVSNYLVLYVNEISNKEAFQGHQNTFSVSIRLISIYVSSMT